MIRRDASHRPTEGVGVVERNELRLRKIRRCLKKKTLASSAQISIDCSHRAGYRSRSVVVERPVPPGKDSADSVGIHAVSGDTVNDLLVQLKQIFIRHGWSFDTETPQATPSA